MSEEEKEALEELKKIKHNSFAIVVKDENWNKDISYFTVKHKKTILNLIDKQNKMIDEILDLLQDNLNFSPLNGLNKEELKQYFIRKVEDDEKK